MPSVLDVAKRALVKVLKKLAVKYGVKLKLTRDSTQKDVNAAFKKVSLRAHPDKGGEKTDFQNLSNANDSWQEALQNKGTPGRPSTEVGVPRPTTAAGSVLASLEEKKKFRVHSQAVLLTYQGFPAELNSFLEVWFSFLVFVQSNLRTWKVSQWSATAETNEDLINIAQLHLYISFRTVNEICCASLQIRLRSRLLTETNKIRGSGSCAELDIDGPLRQVLESSPKTSTGKCNQKLDGRRDVIWSIGTCMYYERVKCIVSQRSC